MSSDFLTLTMPWWEFSLRAVIVYVALLVMVRLAGKRTLGQLTPFDLILIILLGNAVQNSLLGGDVSLLGGLVIAVTLIALNYIVGWITARSPFAHTLIEGEAVRVAENGRIDYRKLRSEAVSLADFKEAMRRAEVNEVADIKGAWIETDGTITIQKETGALLQQRSAD